jgi:hypothetical protein
MSLMCLDGLPIFAPGGDAGWGDLAQSLAMARCGDTLVATANARLR